MIFSLVEEVEFCSYRSVDKSYGIDRAEPNPLARKKNCSSMKSGNSSRAGSAPDKRVGIELSLFSR